MSLKGKTFLGIKWTATSAIAGSVLQLLQVAILARILTPKDFGLMALVMVVIGFSQAFLDMGVSNAIIYKQEISNRQFSSLYWLNVLSGAVIFFILMVLAPFVASFYSEPELTGLVRLVAVTFLIQPFGQQFMILLQKELSFDQIARVEILNKVITLIITVILALNGLGVYSLAFGAIVSVLVSTGQYLFIGSKFYKPAFILEFREIKEFLYFGLYQTGERTINYFNFQVDVLLIGKLAGTTELGIYNIAKQIIMQPGSVLNPIITRVTFPAMAKIQEQTGKLKDVYLKQINYLSSVNFPVYAAMFVFSEEIIQILFGPKWQGAVIILKILSVWGAVRSIGNPMGSLLLAKGKANWGFWWNLGLFFYAPVAVCLGSLWNLTGISFALVLMQASLIIPGWFFLVKKLCGAGFTEYHKQIMLPALISAASGFLVYLALIFVPNAAVRLIAGTVLGLVLVALMNYKFNTGFMKDLSEFKNS